jgi:hypothetical protein
MHGWGCRQGNTSACRCAHAPVTSVHMPQRAAALFCYGNELPLQWEMPTEWQAFRVYKGPFRVQELTRSDPDLHASGPLYYYNVPGPMVDEIVGVSAVVGGRESPVAYNSRRGSCPR